MDSEPIRGRGHPGNGTPDLRLGPSRGRRALLVFALLSLVGGRPSAGATGAEPRLDDLWERWLTSVESVLTDREREAFLALAGDRAREGFATALWQARGREAQARWVANREVAVGLGSLAPARAALALRAGAPSEIERFPACGSLRPVEVWRWDPWSLERQGGTRARGPGRQPGELVLVLYQRDRFDRRTFRPWEPGDLDALGLTAPHDAGLAERLEAETRKGCVRGFSAVRLQAALSTAVGLSEFEARTPWPRGDPAWLDAFLERGGPSRWPARLTISFPGTFTLYRYTVVHGRVAVPVSRLEEVAPGRVFDRVVLAGDVRRGSRLVDSFEVVHHVAGSPTGSEIGLDFYRRLRPGSYALRLRVADRNGLALFHETLDLQVPALQEVAPEPPGIAGGFSRLTRAEVVRLDTLPSVEIPPVATRGARRVRVEALTTGGPIGSVEFLAGGVSLRVDEEAPYLTEVDLGPAGVDLRAVALDPLGRRLAADERRLERQAPAFAVRLLEPRSVGAPAPVEVDLPSGGRVASVECSLGRQRVPAAQGPPWTCPWPVAGSPISYVTVTVTLDDGTRAEDVLFLGDRELERVDVRLVELTVSVFDASGRPVPGLRADEFRVLDGGEERPLERFEALADVPLNVALLMDVSSSMGRRVHLAAESAQRFFDDVLRGRDLASLLAFNHDLHRLVPFTSDARLLRHGASALRAWGASRLHDAIVYALVPFAGLDRRRALVILSDGADVGSDYPLPQVIQAASRAGVAVYPIVLGDVGEETRAGLARLAEATGGSSFSAADVEALDAVYRRIEQALRSQYLLVYRPPDGDREPALRPLEVRTTRAGLTARGVRRYNPSKEEDDAPEP